MVSLVQFDYIDLHAPLDVFGVFGQTGAPLKTSHRSYSLHAGNHENIADSSITFCVLRWHFMFSVLRSRH